ncbi:DUF1236 domain-containing protein, partial [Methylobacterium oxalidis]
GERGGREGRDGAGERGGREGRDGAAERGDRDGRGGAADRDGRGGREGATERGGAASRTEARGAVSRLDTRQRTEFRQSITRVGVSPVRNVNFSLNVGTAIPRSVTLHTLPPAILTLVPAYRGYRFILVEDDVVIIDPDTYEIIDVIPA